MLSLSNESQQLVELVLDRLFQLLDVDSCWVQLLDAAERDLRLVACRGFTSRMKQAAGLADSADTLSSRVAMGLRAAIGDLSRDGSYGLTAFVEAGLRSVIAVPIRTYRTLGVIGIAGRHRRQFPAAATGLLAAIAGMLGASLNSAELARVAPVRPLGMAEAPVPTPDVTAHAMEPAVEDTDLDVAVSADDGLLREPDPGPPDDASGDESTEALLVDAPPEGRSNNADYPLEFASVESIAGDGIEDLSAPHPDAADPRQGEPVPSSVADGTPPVSEAPADDHARRMARFRLAHPKA